MLQRMFIAYNTYMIMADVIVNYRFRPALNIVLYACTTECPKNLPANLYCISLSIPQIYTSADTVQICGKFKTLSIEI